MERRFLSSYTLLFLLVLPPLIKLFKRYVNDNKLSLVFFKHLQAIRETRKPRFPPDSTPWPIVGNLPEMLANRPTFRWIQKLMNDLHTEVACIRINNVHVILVSSPEIARELLIKQDIVFASRPTSWFSEYVSSGYLTTTFVPFGEQWKKMRKVIANDLLSPFRHQWLHNKRLEEADNLIRYVYNRCKSGDNLVNVRVVAQHYAGNVIRKLFFNKRYFGNKDGGHGLEEVEYMKALFIVLELFFAFSISDYMSCLRGLNLDGHEWKMKEACKTVRKFHDPIIEDRIQQWKFGKKTLKEDLLDVLISLKDSHDNALLTEEEIKSQILVIRLLPT